LGDPSAAMDGTPRVVVVVLVVVVVVADVDGVDGNRLAAAAATAAARPRSGVPKRLPAPARHTAAVVDGDAVARAATDPRGTPAVAAKAGTDDDAAAAAERAMAAARGGRRGSDIYLGAAEMRAMPGAPPLDPGRAGAVRGGIEERET